MKPTGETRQAESGIRQVVLELEMNLSLRVQLREPSITTAEQREVVGAWKAIIDFVPVPQLKSFQKMLSPARVRIGGNVPWEKCAAVSAQGENSDYAFFINHIK